MNKKVKKEIKKIIEELQLDCDIDSFKNEVNWDYISKCQKLSEDFIRKFQNKVDWNNISWYQKLSEDLIKKFQNKINWDYISQYQKLSKNFIREFKDEVNWYNISRYQKLSENFIKEFQDKVNWYYISESQKLSENFIREFKDEVEWFQISKYQKLSENFIKEFQDKVNWYYISESQKLSKDFIKEFDIKIDNDNWLYKTTKFKEKELTKYGLYQKNKEGYYVAYKGIRSDRYSYYNFQYQYLPNKTYTTHADHTYEENSFGLSAWTYEKAKEYCNELVVEVWFKPEWLARIVQGGGKLRLKKLIIKS